MKERIVLSGVNLVEMGPIAVFKDALESLSGEHSSKYEIIALVHKSDIFDTPNVTYLEFPEVKSSWLRRLHFEYWRSRNLSLQLQPLIWISMHDITPNVTAPIRAVYCHNPSPFYSCGLKEALADWKFGLFTLFYRFLYRINIHANNFVIVQQQWIRRQFQRVYGLSNVVVAHPAVRIPGNSHEDRAGGSTKTYKFFYPAYPRTFKNIEVSLEAARILEKRNFRDFELWLTVDGSINGYADSLVKKFSGISSVRWLGLVSRSRIFELYVETDCLLFPSKLETWGLPITEFRSFSKPILSADLPYAHETAGGYGQIAFFDPENPEELANLMQGAATGESVFHKTEEIMIEEPFARNWSQLWSILFRGTDQGSSLRTQSHDEENRLGTTP